MDTQILETFVVAARTENFRKAADLRFLSQATVTQHVRKLEDELGLSLFDRSGRRVRLNQAGASFLVHAEEILGETEAAKASLAPFRGRGRGALRILASPHVGRVLLPSLLRRYLSARPGLPWSLVIRPSGEIPRLMEAGEADVGLARARPLGGTLRAELLQEDPFVLAVPHDGLDMDREMPSWGDILGRFSLLVHGPEALWVAVRGALASRGVPVRTMDVQQVDVAKAFVLSGLGVSFLPLSAVREEIRLGFLLAVPTAGLALPPDATWALCPRRPSDGGADFLGFLRAALGP